MVQKIRNYCATMKWVNFPRTRILSDIGFERMVGLVRMPPWSSLTALIAGSLQALHITMAIFQKNKSSAFKACCAGRISHQSDIQQWCKTLSFNSAIFCWRSLKLANHLEDAMLASQSHWQHLVLHTFSLARMSFKILTVTSHHHFLRILWSLGKQIYLMTTSPLKWEIVIILTDAEYQPAISFHSSPVWIQMVFWSDLWVPTLLIHTKMKLNILNVMSILMG